MSFLDKAERALGRYAVPNLSLYLVIGQFVVLLLALMGSVDLDWFILVPDLAKGGEWWRVLAFIFRPPPPDMFGYLLIAFSWYMFHLMGSALEGFWGVFRYNLFLLVGYILTVAVSFLTPQFPATNLFLAGSVFLAFAYLNPEFEIMLFFILPIKIKWLALLTWVGYGYTCFVGGTANRLQVLAAVGNFLLFFSGDILRSARHGRRKMANKAGAFSESGEARHTCHVCRKTNRTHPELDFRYCSTCSGDQCYCPDHIRNHSHVVGPNEPNPG